MNKDKGWIKVHRSIMENWVYDDPFTLKVFLHLCMTVNIKEKKTMIDGNFATIKPGQRVTSEKRLATELGSTWRTVNKILADLEADDMIKRQPIGRGFILTVTNYKKFQLVLASTDASTLPSTFTSTEPSTDASRQLKKGKDRLKKGKDKPVKEPAQRGGWIGKGEPPK